ARDVSLCRVAQAASSISALSVHDEGYQVDRQPDGELRFRRPDGRVLPEVPRPRTMDLPVKGGGYAHETLRLSAATSGNARRRAPAEASLEGGGPSANDFSLGGARLVRVRTYPGSAAPNATLSA